MKAVRLVGLLLVAALGAPSTAVAQRDAFLGTLVQFYQTLRGAYGDEGPQLEAQVDGMTAALAAWDLQISAAETQFRPLLQDADEETALRVHAVLASLYLDRGRYEDALREFEADIAIDPTRAAFHRYAGILLQATGRSAQAGDAFRAMWLLEPAEPQNAYRLLVHRSDAATAPEIDQALATLAQVEGELIRLERPAVQAPFRTTRPITDDAGGAMAFVPPAYASGFSRLLGGDFAGGVSLLREAVAADPLVADAASGSEALAQGIAALRQGQVETAIDRLEAAVTGAGDSSEAHRILAAAYGVRGDMARSVEHLRDAVRLNPTDERSWVALARTLEETGEPDEAMNALRTAIAALPESGALRWRLRLLRGERIDESDLELIGLADRLVLFAGQGELLGRLAAMAQGDLDYEQAVRLFEQRVALNPNNAAAHAALGRALVDLGREEAGYAELVTALLLDPLDPTTLTALGRQHLAAGRTAQAITALERALALQPDSSEALQALGSALTLAGRTAEGQQRLEESVRRQEADVEDQRDRRRAAMLVVQGDIHLSQGEYDAAVDAWKDALAIRQGSVGTLQLADALVSADRLDEAAAVLEAAIQENARPETHRRLAEVYAALGRPEESAREREAYTELRLAELRGGG